MNDQAGSLLSSATSKGADFEITDHQYGKLLRLRTQEVLAMGCAIEILALFEKELDATIDDTRWRQDYVLRVAAPVSVQFDGLRIELEIDGRDITLGRVRGGEREFADLCEFVCEQLSTVID